MFSLPPEKRWFGRAEPADFHGMYHEKIFREVLKCCMDKIAI
jgi:hypothetical protein